MGGIRWPTLALAFAVLWLVFGAVVPRAAMAGAGAPAAMEAPAVPARDAGALDAAAGPARAAPEAAGAPATPSVPAKVETGIYVNDIQDIDFRTSSFSADFYIWFRWKDGALDPAKTMEFMNRFQPNDHRRDSLLDAPKAMPDGSKYALIRAQGRFSAKFELDKYPFDEQQLTIVFEDTTNGDTRQIYVPDKPAVTLNPYITLPGFKIGRPQLRIIENLYPTNFGDQTVAEQEAYSRAMAVLPITRPLAALSLKTFVPVLLMIVCSALALLVRPQHVDGRIGLSITALLTLVAVQLMAGASQPDVDDLTMLDQVYLASYAFIVLVLARVAATSWTVADEARAGRVARNDRRMAFALGLIYLLALAGIGAESLVMI